MKKSFEITFYLFASVLGFYVALGFGGKPVTAANAVLLLVYLGLTLGNLFMAVDTIRTEIKEGMTPEPTGKTADNFKRV